jgi:prepilin-type N-terminal cleavage/methylation domain-containing protein
MLETLNTDVGSGPRHKGQGGFTLVELLIVIVILAVLAAIVVFAVGTTSKNAVAASCSADAKSVETAMAAYDAQIAAYPSNISALASTASVPGGGGQWVGPWLRAVPGTTHYVIFNDSAGDLFVIPPGQGSGSVGAAYAVTGVFTANATAGGTFDFDADPAICGQYS